MGDGPNLPNEATRAELPVDRRRDTWLERRLHFLVGEQARLKGNPPLRRFLRGAPAAYRRFLFTADPAHRFHAWATIQAVSARLDTNSNPEERVMKSPGPHRTARTRGGHWWRAWRIDPFEPNAGARAALPL